jgi:hypothetical protein
VDGDEQEDSAWLLVLRLGTRTMCGTDGVWQTMDGVRVGSVGSALRALPVSMDADDHMREIKYLH